MQLPDVDFEFNDTGLYITVNGVKIARRLGRGIDAQPLDMLER
jgi:hypothetical protein